MHVLRALHSAIWLFCVSGSFALAQSASDMLHAYEILQRGMHVEGATVYLPPGNDVQQCWGFMNAVLQYATLANQNGKTLLNACPGPDTTVTQVIGVFVAYARSHPEKLYLKPAAIAYNAMADAFHCK
jgi:Rap1a immunity proteins